MNNFYTLIYLKQEIKEKITGGFFNFAISPHKDVLHIYVTKNDKESRLIFSANFKETALFWDTYRPPKKNNVLSFFSSLEGKQIKDVELADHDRLFSVLFEDDIRLLFKLFSGHPNVYLVINNQITDAFKNPDRFKGNAPPTPQPPVFQEEVSPKRSAKNQMTEVNPLLPRNLLPHMVKLHKVEEMSPQQVTAFTERATEALREDPHPRVLKTGDFCLWSEKWLDIPSVKECNEVNDCVSYAYKNAVHLRRLHEKQKDVVDFLARSRTQKKDLVKQLRQADRSLERAEKYEKFGHLLMAHAHETLTPGTEKLTVKDIYEEGKEITIPLREKKGIPHNAEYYYSKAKDARKSFEHARERLPKAQQELDHIGRLLEEVTKIDRLPELQDWLKDHSSQLQQVGYGNSEQKQASSPFRKYMEGRYEIWIGKNAKSNDKLTNHAHKEDIWLHARGVGGSHVVIRMGNRKEYPPQRVLLKAASYAAFFSKAKGMKSVPVMYTKSKYVRKPKGAAPGAVVLEREKVQMVPPMKPKDY